MPALQTAMLMEEAVGCGGGERNTVNFGYFSQEILFLCKSFDGLWLLLLCRFLASYTFALPIYILHMLTVYESHFRRIKAIMYIYGINTNTFIHS